MTSLLLPLIGFVVAATLTPGPNNIMLTASGVNFGFKRSLPHISGIIIGLPLMVLAVGLGLGQVFTVFPQLHEILKWAGSIYLLFLAWKIATAGKPRQTGRESSPLTFMQAALFQWINPKGWIMATAALSNFTSGPDNYLTGTLLVTATFLIAALGSTSLWTYFGAIIGRWLNSPTTLLIFNGFMAILIVGSIALLYL